MTRSEQLFAEAQLHIPGGVNSPVRAFRGVGGTPIFFKRGVGAWLYDEDDRRYIDYVGSWGPMIAGHAHPAVVRAVRDAAAHGLSFAAREMGAEAVEIDARHELRPDDLSQTGVRQVRKMLDDLNLRVSAVSYRTRRGYQVADDLEARIEATKRALKLAYDLGTNVVVNHIGRVPAETDTEATSTMVQALADIGRHSHKVGAFLAAETGTESGADLAKLIARLPPGAIGVDLNPAELVLNGHSPPEAVRALGPHVLHVHARDATRDLSLGRGIEVPLGRGNAELPELLAVLEEHQYRGFITIERRDAADPIGEIRQAIEFLRNL